MEAQNRVLEIVSAGDITVVRFRGRRFVSSVVLPQLDREVTEILESNHPSVIQFDMAGVALLTSALLGFFVSLQQRGVDVILSNPSEDVRCAIEAIRLHEIVRIDDGNSRQDIRHS